VNRILMLIALLALVLNGQGQGVAGTPREPVRACAATCVAEVRAETRPLPCCPGAGHRCHSGKPLGPPALVTPGAPTAGPERSEPDREPFPWPGTVALAGFPAAAMAPGTRGLSAPAALPAAFPGILARSCVLRI
jgi:hypothetical protein